MKAGTLLLLGGAAVVGMGVARSLRNAVQLDVRFKGLKWGTLSYPELAVTVQVGIVNPTLQEFVLNQVAGKIVVKGQSVGIFSATLNLPIGTGELPVTIPATLYLDKLLPILGQVINEPATLEGEARIGRSVLPVKVTFNLPRLALPA